MTLRDVASILPAMLAAHEPVLVSGPPGLGKTDLITQVTSGLGWDLLTMHPVVSDPTDFKGFPWLTGGGEAEFVPFGDLRRLLTATEPLVCFLDDLGQASPSVQAAAMQLLLARRVNGHAVADCVSFAAATNRRRDRAAVGGIIAPLLSRMTGGIYEIEPDLESWIQWALDANMPAELIAFARWRPRYVTETEITPEIAAYACPRTLAAVGRAYGRGVPQGAELAAYSAIAGQDFGGEFTGFLRICQNLPDPRLCIASPATAEVPTDPAVLFALCGALARLATKDNAEKWHEYIGRLPREFGVVAVRDMIRRVPQMTETKSHIEWLTRNQGALLN